VRPSDPAVRRPAGGLPGHPEDAPGDPESVARAICLRLLTLQPRTRAELAAALSKRGVPDDAAGTVLSRFAEVGLIDDRAFAAAWVDSRHAGRGLSRRALAAELRRRGVDGEIVGEAVAVVDTEAEERAARQLVDRRLASTRRLDQPARVRRLAGMLARKGYPAASRCGSSGRRWPPRAPTPGTSAGGRSRRSRTDGQTLNPRWRRPWARFLDPPVGRT